MSTTSSPDRRFIVALTAAVASATLAIGVTTGALLGWIGPGAAPGGAGGATAAGPGSSQVVYVPITPTSPPPSNPNPSVEPLTGDEPRFAMAEPSAHRNDRDDRRGHDEDDDD